MTVGRRGHDRCDACQVRERLHCPGDTRHLWELAREKGATSALRRSPSTQAHERPRHRRDPRPARCRAVPRMRRRSRVTTTRRGASAKRTTTTGSGQPERLSSHPLARPPHPPRLARSRRATSRAPCTERSPCAPRHAQLRNVALVAHVDHGKTTLVDAMLRATGVFSDHQALVDRVMDSNDQERERGITILAKAASVTWGDMRINLVDTPGPRRLRRRGRAGAGHGRRRAAAGRRGRGAAAPDPLRAVEGAGRRAARRCVVLNKVDRQDARADEVLDEIYQLFLDLDADDDDDRVPGHLGRRPRGSGRCAGVGMPGDDADLTAAASRPSSTRVPAADRRSRRRRCRPSSPTSTPPTTSGRLAIGRVIQGTLRKGEQVALLRGGRGPGPAASASSASSWASRASAASRSTSASPATCSSIAGFPEVEIGDTIADPADPEAAAPPRASTSPCCA